MEDISIVYLRRVKNFARSTAYSSRTCVFIEFHHFMEKRIDTAED